MKVTYIGHSGFLLQWENCSWLFDYYEGELPELPKEQPLFVFVSHWHSDHFNPAVFSLTGPSEIIYILSEDIRRHVKNISFPEDCRFVGADQCLKLEKYGLSIKTLHSTDCGVAFLISYKGKNIYHAGDLNWWVWEGESKQYNQNMTANFKKYTEPLEGLDLFMAFLPLDPRQESWYDKGFLYILEHTQTKYAFPMHFWKDFSVISRFLSSAPGTAYRSSVIALKQEGETLTLSES